MYDFVEKLRSVKYKDLELPFGIIKEEMRYRKHLSDDMLFSVYVERREDIDEDDFAYAVTVWENHNLVKKELCEDYLSAVKIFFEEIVKFEREHNFITSSYRPE